MYFAATIAIHHSAARGGGTFHGSGAFHEGVALLMGGWHFPWGGVDFGPSLVEGWQGGGGIYGGGVS